MEVRSSISHLFVERGRLEFDRVKIIVPFGEVSEEYYGRGQLSIYEHHLFRLTCEFDFGTAKERYRGQQFELKWPNLIDGVDRGSFFDIFCYQNTDEEKISWYFPQAMRKDDFLPLFLQSNTEFLSRYIEVTHGDEVNDGELTVKCFVDGKSFWNVLDYRTFVIEAHRSVPELAVTVRSDEHAIVLTVNSHCKISSNIGKILLEALSIAIDKTLVPNVTYFSNEDDGVYQLFSECRNVSGVLPLFDSRYGPDHIVEGVQEFLAKYCYYNYEFALGAGDRFGDIWYLLKQIRDASVVSVDLEILTASVVAEAFISLPEFPVEIDEKQAVADVVTDIKESYRLVSAFIRESNVSEKSKTRLENAIRLVLSPDKNFSFKHLMQTSAIRDTDFESWKNLRNVHVHLQAKNLANTENIRKRWSDLLRTHMLIRSIMFHKLKYQGPFADYADKQTKLMRYPFK